MAASILLSSFSFLGRLPSETFYLSFLLSFKRFQLGWMGKCPRKKERKKVAEDDGSRINRAFNIMPLSDLPSYEAHVFSSPC